MAKQVSEKGLKWFQDIRFGMFVHWGPTAVAPRHDWLMHGESISVADYEKIAARLNPTQFNADEWVSIAADAGQKYMVFTTKHHDGFSMFDTALSDYKITNFTAFKRDPVRELVNACAKRGDIKMGFYHSLLDWHHPAYRFRKESGLAWSDYIAFMHGQVRELCTDYGEIACMWFDGDWPNHKFDETDSYFLPPQGEGFEYDKLYDMIHTLQPDAVVINNRHADPLLPAPPLPFFSPDLPGLNSTGFNSPTIADQPLEVCMTINDHWFHIADSINYKSTKQLVSLLVRSASAGANFLLNVGPLETGEIAPVHAARLQGISMWMKDHSESIYGTRAGVIPPSAISVSTRKGDTHYVHVLEYVSDCVRLKRVPENIQQAHLLKSGDAVRFERRNDEVILTIPEHQHDLFDTVVVLS